MIILHHMDRPTRFIFSLTTKTNYALYSKPRVSRNDLVVALAEGGNITLLQKMAKKDEYSVVNTFCVQGAMKGGRIDVLLLLLFHHLLI